MSDNNDNSQPSAAPLNAPNDEKSPPKAHEHKPARGALILASSALLISLASSGALYWQLMQAKDHSESQQKLLLTSSNERHSQHQQAQGELESQIQQLNTQLKTQQQLITQQQQQLQASQLQRQQVQNQLAKINVKDANHWRLNEAAYLIKLAAKKLELERNIDTAQALLNEADQTVLLAQDPQLLGLRRAISQDISKLNELERPDLDGIALQLEAMIAQIQLLQLADIDLPKAEEEQSLELSDSASDWRDNLKKSGRKFLENFVTIRRRDAQVEALIEPQHVWYLNENLKLQLRQAEQALLQGKSRLFQQKLTTSEQWIGLYYQQNTLAKQLRTQLQTLKGQVIEQTLPAQLTSLGEVEDALKSRELRLSRPLNEEVNNG